MSAKDFSIFLKYRIPKMRRKIINPIESIIPGKYIWVLPPKIHQRNPSIIPTIGFIEYNSLHFSGTTLLLKPTGDTYNPNCTTKGTMYLKSRYLTFNAAIYKPAPRAVRMANIRNRGRKRIGHEGVK